MLETFSARRNTKVLQAIVEKPFKASKCLQITPKISMFVVKCRSSISCRLGCDVSTCRVKIYLQCITERKFLYVKKIVQTLTLESGINIRSDTMKPKLFGIQI